MSDPAGHAAIALLPFKTIDRSDMTRINIPITKYQKSRTISQAMDGGWSHGARQLAESTLARCVAFARVDVMHQQ